MLRNRPLIWSLGVLVACLSVSGAVAAATYDFAAHCSAVAWTFYFNGHPKVPRVASGEPTGFICDDTAYVPLRFIGETLGQNVTWDGPSQSVSVNTPGRLQSGPAPQPTGTVNFSGPVMLGLQVTSAHLEIGEHGTPYVAGELVNKTGFPLQTTEIDAAFVDPQGNVLARGMSLWPALQSGQTWQFDVRASRPVDAAGFRLTEVVGARLQSGPGPTPPRLPPGGPAVFPIPGGPGQ